MRRYNFFLCLSSRAGFAGEGSAVLFLSSLRDSGFNFALPSTPLRSVLGYHTPPSLRARSLADSHLRLRPTNSRFYEPALPRWVTHLPAIVGEGLVGLSHTVNIFFLLDGRAFAIGGVKQLIRQLVDHALLATAAAVLQNPADRQ